MIDIIMTILFILVLGCIPVIAIMASVIFEEEDEDGR